MSASGENPSAGDYLLTKYGKRINGLFVEIAAYLAFMDIAREDDHLWKEYCAWKRLSEAGAILRYRG